jgi:hypothetical protein
MLGILGVFGKGFFFCNLEHLECNVSKTNLKITVRIKAYGAS